MAVAKRLSKKRLCEHTTWYLDANALTSGSAMAICVNAKQHNALGLVTHLALGEALGNVIDKHGMDKADLLFDLVQRLRADGKIHFHSFDSFASILDEVRKDFDRLSLTDAVHLSSAIGFKCAKFMTSDTHFSKQNVPRDALKSLCERFAAPVLSIDENQ